MANSNEIPSKKLYISILNIMACLCVIIFHCDGSWVSDVKEHWIYSLVLQTLCVWCVPMFFMITGATLLDYSDRYSTSIYFKKRLIKTVIPFLFWSLVSIPFGYIVSLYNGDNFNWNFIDIFNGALNAKYMAVYWFFIPLFSIYLCIPILTGINDNPNFL